MYKEEDKKKNVAFFISATEQYDYGIIIVVYAFSDNTCVMAEAVNVRQSSANVRVHKISLIYY